MATIPPISPADPPRSRISLELSPAVSLLLDHVADITGSTKVQIANAALLEALPGLLDRSDLISKRLQAVTQSNNAKKR